MDNPQERLHFNIGYLIGILDGEGSYGFSWKHKKKGKRWMDPRIIISNTSQSIIDLTTKVIDNLGLPYHVWTPKRHGGEKHPTVRIQIAGIKRCKRWTDLLKEYPSGKRTQILIMNDFCKRRLSIPQKDKDSRHIDTYNDKDYFYHDLMCAANHKWNASVKWKKWSAKSSETIRQTLEEYSKEDIVRPHKKL